MPIKNVTTYINYSCKYCGHHYYSHKDMAEQCEAKHTPVKVGSSVVYYKEIIATDWGRTYTETVEKLGTIVSIQGKDALVENKKGERKLVPLWQIYRSQLRSK